MRAHTHTIAAHEKVLNLFSVVVDMRRDVYKELFRKGKLMFILMIAIVNIFNFVLGMRGIFQRGACDVCDGLRSMYFVRGLVFSDDSRT